MPGPDGSFVVTGGSGGVGTAIAARLRASGHVEVVAEVVARLLAPGFVSGAIIPVDGGRSVLGHDPEARLPRPRLLLLRFGLTGSLLPPTSRAATRRAAGTASVM
jgi:NAD(P)-dependent dehydrogenase (short-subunit alcohol dehydrogenase family)